MSKRRQRLKKQRIQARQTAAPVSKDWIAVLYRTEDNQVPSLDWLRFVPRPVMLMLLAVINSVRDAPPAAFPASEYWHAMHDEMAGFHEARDEHDGSLYRLFCLLDRKAVENGLEQPALAIIGGGIKRVGAAMDQSIYAEMMRWRDDYLATNPRRILLPPGIPLPARR